MGGEFENAGSDAEVYSLHTEAALLATRFVIEKAEAFTKANGKKLLVILSFSSHNVANALKGEPLFDQTFLDWLAAKDVPIIDLRDAFREEYATYRGDVQTFLTPYYIGHHTPRGKFLLCLGDKRSNCRMAQSKTIALSNTRKVKRYSHPKSFAR